MYEEDSEQVNHKAKVDLNRKPTSQQPQPWPAILPAGDLLVEQLTLSAETLVMQRKRCCMSWPIAPTSKDLQLMPSKRYIFENPTVGGCSQCWNQYLHQIFQIWPSPAVPTHELPASLFLHNTYSSRIFAVGYLHFTCIIRNPKIVIPTYLIVYKHRGCSIYYPCQLLVFSNNSIYNVNYLNKVLLS